MLGTVGARTMAAQTDAERVCRRVGASTLFDPQRGDAAGDQAARVNDGSVRREASDRRWRLHALVSRHAMFTEPRVGAL